jgi:hypothetical protein
LRSLQANLQREYDESHTFSPRLVAKHISASKVPHSGKGGAPRIRSAPGAGGGDGGGTAANKPVHERLYEMGAEYRRKQEERNEVSAHVVFISSPASLDYLGITTFNCILFSVAREAL